ncbi:MAG TPA: dTMP kinase [Candidatus Binatus sp.]|nr:dTMP kinase [Candidatus Binatus sp.]
MSLFVTFEGIEGSGKSTHLRHLATHLRTLGRVVVATREPGGTAAGTAIRRLLLDAEAVPLSALAELLLYCADRAQHVEEVIRPGLVAGRVVLCDRFSESTIAYQGYGRGIDLETVRSLDARARNGVTPTLTFLLDCPVAEGLARVRKRSGTRDRFEREVVDFHERVRDGFRALAAGEPTRFCVIDATEPADRVRDRVIAEMERRLQELR